VLGRSMAGDAGAGDPGGVRIPEPGPTVPIGEFTSNLAGSGRHITSFNVSFELINNARAVELVGSDGWHIRIRNEILLIIKDKAYEDLTSAEGMLQFGEEIKRAVNSLLPFCSILSYCSKRELPPPCGHPLTEGG